MQQIVQQNLDPIEAYKILDMIDTSIYWKDCNGKYLGCNRYFLEIFGLTNPKEVIGKTDYDFFKKEDADQLRDHDSLAIKNERFIGEEQAMINGQVEYYSTTKTVLVDILGNVIGIFGTSVRITDIKNQMEEEKQLAISYEEQKIRQIIDVVDASIYWKDREGRYIGCNKYVLGMAGLSNLDEIIGKTDFEMLWKNEAPKLIEIDNMVMATGNRYEGEELISIAKDDGKLMVVFTVKNQLLDDQGTVIGVVGTSLDITAKKEMERLKAEHQANQISQQEKFKKVAAQVAHDISSPIAALKMIVPHCDTLTENTRKALNTSATRIFDIANNFLSQFKQKQNETTDSNDNSRYPTLIYTELMEIVTEKKYEYSHRAIEFTSKINQNSYFAFINVDVSAFKRMISNLINNAVEALDGKSGTITVHLDVIADKVQVVIGDDGKGMPQEVKEKLLNNIEVTAGKEKGHGIGFGQIRETLTNNEGDFNIESEIGKGTKIILTFPKVETQEWVAEKLEFTNDDLIVILDDEPSIHAAWEWRLKEAVPNIRLEHFEQGKEAVNFLNKLTEEEKEHVMLLTDYELLKQELNGLDVIEQTKIKRSVLVTSHHNKSEIREVAKRTNTKILPKLLASEVQINVIEIGTISRQQINNTTIAEPQFHPQPAESLKTVDLVILDDDKNIVEAIMMFIVTNDEVVDKYHVPQDLLNNVHQYSKDTKFLIDNNYEGEDITGIDIASELYELGFSKLYLFTGEIFDRYDNIPSYLRVIAKDDLAAIKQLLSL